MNTRPIIIASLCAILFVVAVYFGGRLQLQQERIDDPPTMSDTLGARHQKEKQR